MRRALVLFALLVGIALIVVGITGWPIAAPPEAAHQLPEPIFRAEQVDGGTILFFDQHGDVVGASFTDGGSLP